MGDGVTVESLKTQGNTLFAKGPPPPVLSIPSQQSAAEEWAAAERVYTRAIALASVQDAGSELQATLLSNRSVSRAMQENYSGAFEDAERVVELRPSWTRGYVRKAVALMGKNQLSAAREAVERGQSVDASDPMLSDIAAQLTQLDARSAAKRTSPEDAISFTDALEQIRAAGVTEAVWVVVLSGFLGAGKTTLLTQILTQNHGTQRFAVLVNDMAEINIDADLIQHQHSFSEVQEELVELTNGCVCCTLRGDLIKEATRLLCMQKFDGIVIEATGISEPMPVAATFASEDFHRHSLKDYFRIDNMVTLVDASQFLEALKEPTLLKERRLETTQTDDRSIAELLMDQVEFADTLVINKCDLVSAHAADKIQALVKRLNPSARVLRAVHAQLDVREILNVHRFRLDRAKGFDGFATELVSPHISETEQYGVASWVLKSPVPFHPVRLHALLFGAEPTEEDRLSADSALRWVFRSKGVFYLASALDAKLTWSTAGPRVQFEIAERWLASMLPEHLWNQRDLDFHPVFGDRAQKLVFIAPSTELPQIRAAVEACLLTDAEIDHGASHWAELDSARLWRLED